MHTGLEDRARDFPKLAAYFAARARGGAGLLVSGGIAPNRAGLGQAVRRKAVESARSGAASAGDRRRACRGRQDLHADPAHRPLRLPPVSRGAERAARAHQPIQAPRVVLRWRARPDRGLRELRRAGARGRLRRRRDHGFGRLLHQRVPRAAHQQARPTSGAARWRTARGSRSKSCGRRAQPWAATSSSSFGSPASTWWKAAARAPRWSGWHRRWKAPARPCSTPASAGTRRAYRRSPAWCRAAPSAGFRRASRRRRACR